MSAIDRYPSQYAKDISGPAEEFFPITPSDTADLQFVTRAIWVGGAGDIAAVNRAGQVVIHKGATAGREISIRTARVMDTGTTATDLVGWA